MLANLMLKTSKTYQYLFKEYLHSWWIYFKKQEYDQLEKISELMTGVMGFGEEEHRGKEPFHFSILKVGAKTMVYHC